MAARRADQRGSEAAAGNPAALHRGIVEARSPGGEFFGEERLARLVVQAEGAGEAPPEMLRQLMRSVMEHQAGQLQDDASIVVVEWRSGREEQLFI